MTPIQPPMTDERLDRLIRQLLNERADDIAVVAMPAQTMAAVVGSHVRRGRAADRRVLLLVAAALLMLAAVGALAVGSGFVRDVTEPQPTPQPVVPARSSGGDDASALRRSASRDLASLPDAGLVASRGP